MDKVTELKKLYKGKVLGIRIYESSLPDYYVDDFLDAKKFDDFFQDMVFSSHEITPAGYAFLEDYGFDDFAKVVDEKGVVFPDDHNFRVKSDNATRISKFIQKMKPMELALIVAGDSAGRRLSQEDLNEDYLPPKKRLPKRIKTSQSFLDKYGYADEKMDVSEFLQDVEKRFCSEFDFEKYHLELHRMKYSHGPTVVLYRPAQNDDEFDAALEVSDKGKKKEFSWAFDDNWDERWNDKDKERMYKLEGEELDDVDYLIYIMKSALDGNFKLEIGMVGDMPYQWVGFKKENDKWIRGTVINHFIGFQTYIRPHKKHRKELMIKA